MLQVVQHQKSGKVSVEETPAPQCHKNGILVQNYFSLISAGTEKVSVENAKANLLQRAKRQPEQVKQVVDNLKKEGLASTIKKVGRKLNSYKALGYSSSGIVVESNCDEFSVGDRVACGGAGYANHAEFVAIPKNLAIKIPENVSGEEAAFATVGSIAVQGLRQAKIEFGETVAVIGLGLIGQLTVRLLSAAGCRIVGLDVDESLFEQAKISGCDAVFPSRLSSASDVISFARGVGCDKAVICAGTGSNQPLELALEIVRKRGAVVIVGAVGMNVPRPPFYMKEIDIRISKSYGAGRYDANYEERGLDYPPEYARWTENRNMQAFLDLISKGKLGVKPLISHIFKAHLAEEAYKIITGEIAEDFLAILLEYPQSTAKPKKTVHFPGKSSKNKLSIAFIGFGNYAQNHLLPGIKEAGAELYAVSTSKSVNSYSAAGQFGFKAATSDFAAAIKDANVDAVFCAAPHDVHAQIVIDSIAAGKPVFVEKPLCVTEKQLETIEKTVYLKNGFVMVGFNRRFSKALNLAKAHFANRSEPMVMNYRVNAGTLPKTHWVYDEDQRGRIIGEVCHFVDSMVYMTDALPKSVYAVAASSDVETVENRENVVISLKFTDGSVGSIQYISSCSPQAPKEYFEISCQKKTAAVDNFETLVLYGDRESETISTGGSKGHRDEIKATAEAMKTGAAPPIKFEEIRAVTKATFAAVESLKTGNVKNIR